MRNLQQLFLVARLFAGDVFELLARHQESALELQGISSLVACGLQPVYARVKVWIWRRPARMAWKSGQLGILNVRRALNRLQQLFTASFDQSSAQPRDVAQLRNSRWHAARKLEQRFIGEDAENCDVARLACLLTPGMQLTQYGEFARFEIARAFRAQKCVILFGYFPTRFARQLKLFFRPFQTPALDQLFAQ